MPDVYTLAPPGTVYVCSACGKTSRTKAGIDAAGHDVADPLWDESCLLNAVLCYESGRESGQWVAVESEVEHD